MSGAEICGHFVHIPFLYLLAFPNSNKDNWHVNNSIVNSITYKEASLLFFHVNWFILK